MNFIDKTTVFIRAGAGGDGKMSFRQEKFISKGGPDGGDGGNGADVVFVASRNQNTLAAFRYQKELLAEPGQSGGKNKMHGRSGKALLVPVPVGTIVTDAESDNILADLTEDGQQVVIAKGGKGGFGNAHFTSSRRQTPRFAEKGEAGVELNANLELKMIADVGLVGLPNAGKSTLLSRISNAHPEIADYPFTTLKPHLGVVDIDKESSLLVADIPGLIEGAAEGKGLGHEFLRHIERTAVLVHLIDAYSNDIAEAYQTIQAELEAYGTDLSKKPQIVVLNKIDGLDTEIIKDLTGQLQAVIPKKTPILTISAASGAGVQELLRSALKIVVTERQKVEKASKEEDALPVLRLSEADDKPWDVTPVVGGFRVTGPKIEQFAARTNYDNEEAVQRLRDIMRKLGIMRALQRQGIEPGQTIYIGDKWQFAY
jgi:GTP-binding protein